jgi:hypothetical protein
MNNVFNTVFEVSLRILLTLEASPHEWLSSERIAASDFIAIYGKDFGAANENLHGDNNYRYSEFALRREIVRNALKSLVTRQLADVRETPEGFSYSLSPLGGGCCAELEGNYADEYRELAAKIKVITANLSEREIIGLINSNSVFSIKGSITNG